MSESDGKTWAMVKPETGERVSVEQLSDEAPRNDGAAIDKLWGQVRSALERGLGRVDSGVFAVVLHAIRTAESLGRNEERKRIEDEVSEANRAAFVAARRETLADAIVLRRGVPGGSGWEGARYDADGNAASTVGHADPLVVLAAVLGKEAPADERLRSPERDEVFCPAPGCLRQTGHGGEHVVSHLAPATPAPRLEPAALDALWRRHRDAYVDDLSDAAIDDGFVACAAEAFALGAETAREQLTCEASDDILRARERGVAEGWTRYRQGAIVLRCGLTPEGGGWLVSRYADNGDPVGSAHDLNPLRAVEHVLGAGELPRVDLAGYGGHLAGIRDQGPCPSARPDSHERCWHRKGHDGRHWAPGVEWTDEQAEAHDLRQLEVSKAREEGEAGALARLRQTTHARLAESGALDQVRADGHRAGIVHALTRVEAEADGYRRRAQAIRVEAEVAEAKADALAGAVAAIRREGAP